MTKSGGLAQIGVHPFDPETGEVRGPCGTTALRPQTSRVLAVLLAAPGRLVSKDHLMNSVWRAARWIAADIPRTVAAYQRAIALDPNYVDANMFLANVYIFDGRAEAALIRARDQNPTAPFPHRFLIATCGQLGDPDEADWMAMEYEALGRSATVADMLATASIQDPVYRAAFADGFRKAGLPEE